jgi:hypothetical protein
MEVRLMALTSCVARSTRHVTGCCLGFCIPDRFFRHSSYHPVGSAVGSLVTLVSCLVMTTSMLSTALW